jgi:mannose-6-phosphate isomerase-like protein (cupin superfamily)
VSYEVYSQTFDELTDFAPTAEFENIHVQKVTEDSLQSCFMIWVKEGVKAHYHAHHTENIVVVSGEAMMTMGDEIFMIKKGDYVNIPKGTIHSVTQVLSDEPLKVLSIQSPQFLGKDRIFVEDND